MQCCFTISQYYLGNLDDFIVWTEGPQIESEVGMQCGLKHGL